MRQAGFTAVEIAILAVMMGILVALVLVLMPAPVVHVEVKEVKLEAPEGDVTFSPESFTFSPKELRVAPERLVLQEPRIEIEERPGEPAVPRGASFEANKVQCLNNVRQLSGLLLVASLDKYPEYGGANLMLYLVKKGEIPADFLEVLFCPGDRNDTLENSGGFAAYGDADLRKREYGYLTSYAGRDMTRAECVIRKGSAQVHVLLCDDSEDHHGNRGIVVGLSDGSAKWRDKVDAYGMDLDAPLVVGETSDIEELVCLREE